MSINKVKLHEACVRQLEEQVTNFENRVVALKSEINAPNEPASQNENRSGSKMELMGNYENELAFSRMELDMLKSLDPNITHEVVEPGAVVMTPKFNFYIAVPTDKIESGAETFTGISTNAPIYSSMEGKKKGDKFSFNESKYEITDIF